MVTKRLLRPERRRRLPAHFSWIDHRLVREGHLARCGPEASALYLFLLTVADAEGLSFYADASIAQRLALDEPRLRTARTRLIDAELIAFEPPLYQVLELPQPPTPQPRADTASRPRALAEILRAMGEPLR